MRFEQTGTSFRFPSSADVGQVRVEYSDLETGQQTTAAARAEAGTGALTVLIPEQADRDELVRFELLVDCSERWTYTGPGTSQGKELVRPPVDFDMVALGPNGEILDDTKVSAIARPRWQMRDPSAPTVGYCHGEIRTR